LTFSIYLTINSNRIISREIPIRHLKSHWTIYHTCQSKWSVQWYWSCWDTINVRAVLMSHLMMAIVRY